MSADPLADLLRVYQDAETALAANLADEVRRAVNRGDDPAAARERLAAVQRLRRQVERVVRALDAQTPAPVRQLLETAAEQGAAAALDQLAAVLGDRVGSAAGPFNRAALDRLAASITDLVTEAHHAILRTTDDAFRRVMARATPGVLVGSDTRRQASQRALWALADQGITGFTDKSGRRWQLSSYVEMPARTAAQRATTDAQADRLLAAGIGLVIVSDNVQECMLCRPWEGRVLSLTGGAGRLTVEHALNDGETVTVDVKASLAAARAAGLFHPNCRHAISAYLPGVTRRPTGPGRGPDPKGDEARQRQRAIERHIRAWKMREATALDQQTARKARDRVRAWQSELRDHLARNPDLKRLRYREQIGAGNLPTEATRRRNPQGPFTDMATDERAGEQQPRPGRAQGRIGDVRVGDYSGDRVGPVRCPRRLVDREHGPGRRELGAGCWRGRGIVHRKRLVRLVDRHRFAIGLGLDLACVVKLLSRHLDCLSASPP